MSFANFKFAFFVIIVLDLTILISRHRISKINLLFLLVYGCDIVLSMEIVRLLSLYKLLLLRNLFLRSS